MSRPRPCRLVSCIASGLVVASAASTVHEPSAQSSPFSGRRTEVGVAERTDAGVWDGTWWYVYRDGRMGLWLRTRDGKPEMKLQFQSSFTPEAFETDWTGASTYFLAGRPGRFKIGMTEADENTIHGTWNWEVDFRTSGRYEDGTFTMYRAHDGRHLVLKFDSYRKSTRKGDEAVWHDLPPPAWAFRKASKRLVLWEELPF